MQIHPSRLNRIPRATPTPPSLCRRLHRWAWAQRLAWINSDIRALQHWMALDQAVETACRLSLADSPATRRRIAQQRTQLGKLITKQGRATLALAQLDCLQ